MEEIDERYNSEVSIDFRKILDHIKEAMEQRPDIRSVDESTGYDTGDWDTPPSLPKKQIVEDPATHFGSRLAHVILNHINKTTIEIGKTRLHRQLMQHAADRGLVDAPLHEGMASKRKSIARLLDDNPFASEIADVRATLIRDLMCDYLRDIHDDIGEDISNDEIMSVKMVRSVMDSLEKNDHGLTEQKTKLLVFNENLDDIIKEPVSEVQALDATPEPGEEDVKKVPVNELLSDKALLVTLAAPSLRHNNLKALWNKALSNSGAVAS
jgi:hypothetical protein